MKKRTSSRPIAAGDERLAQEVGAERGLDPIEALLLQRDRQRAEAQRVVEVGALLFVRLIRRADGDDGLAAADRSVDGRSGDDLAVERDRSRLVHVRGGEFAPDV